MKYAAKSIRNYHHAFSGLAKAFYFTQNDGTIVTSATVQALPVLTFASGPVNSLRGAAILTGLANCIICDIGGTTADFAAMENGFPRESVISSNTAGVIMNFRMPDVKSIGLGGGSHVRFAGGCTVGPQSVEYRVKEDSVSFGGQQLTCTDLALASGIFHMDEAHHVDEAGVDAVTDLVDANANMMKSKPDPTPLVLVGGGSVIVDRTRPIPGISRIVLPDHFGVANAVGAAASKISYDFEGIYSQSHEKGSKEEFLEACLERCVEAIERIGGIRETIEVKQKMDKQMGYMDSYTSLVRIRVVVAADSMKYSERAMCLGFFGAPTTIAEQLSNGKECIYAMEPLARLAGLEPIIAAVEIGGMNSLIPILQAYHAGKPCLDVDLMGRAFPRVDMTSLALYGKQDPPITLADDRKNVMAIFSTYKNQMSSFEHFSRVMVMEMNCSAGMCLAPIDKDTVQRYTVHNSISRAWRLGRAVLRSKQEHRDPIHALEDVEGAKRIMTGKITAHNLREQGGYSYGEVKIEGMGPDSGSEMCVRLQNENYYAYISTDGAEEPVCVSPDLITLVDQDKFDVILCEQLSYGVRVHVLAIPGPELMTRPEIAPKVGPAAYGLKGVQWTPNPLFKYRPYQSVFEEFGGLHRKRTQDEGEPVCTGQTPPKGLR